MLTPSLKPVCCNYDNSELKQLSPYSFYKEDKHIYEKLFYTDKYIFTRINKFMKNILQDDNFVLSAIFCAIEENNKA